MQFAWWASTPLKSLSGTVLLKFTLCRSSSATALLKFIACRSSCAATFLKFPSCRSWGDAAVLNFRMGRSSDDATVLEFFLCHTHSPPRHMGRTVTSLCALPLRHRGRQRQRTACAVVLHFDYGVEQACSAAARVPPRRPSMGTPSGSSSRSLSLYLRGDSSCRGSLPAGPLSTGSVFPFSSCCSSFSWSPMCGCICSRAGGCVFPPAVDFVGGDRFQKVLFIVYVLCRVYIFRGGRTCFPAVLKYLLVVTLSKGFHVFPYLVFKFVFFGGGPRVSSCWFGVCFSFPLRVRVTGKGTTPPSCLLKVQLSCSVYVSKGEE